MNVGKLLRWFSLTVAVYDRLSEVMGHTRVIKHYTVGDDSHVGTDGRVLLESLIDCIYWYHTCRECQVCTHNNVITIAPAGKGRIKVGDTFTAVFTLPFVCIYTNTSASVLIQRYSNFVRIFCNATFEVTFTHLAVLLKRLVMEHVSPLTNWTRFHNQTWRADIHVQ